MATTNDIVVPLLRFPEDDAPSTPAAGEVILYAKSDGSLYQKDDAGTETGLAGGGGGGDVATDDIWDAAGDLAVGSGANTAARLALGSTNGMALRRVSDAVAWDLPPGYEFDYTEYTSGVTVSAVEGSGTTTIVTASEVTFDGSTAVLVEGFFPSARSGAGASDLIRIYLFDGSTEIGQAGLVQTPAAANDNKPTYVSRRLTPTAGAHTYSWRAAKSSGDGDGSVGGGAGGTGNVVPGYIRITKA